MRNIVYAINLSIDGCFDHTQFSADEELFEYFTGLTSEIDLMLYGRITYQMMFPFWSDVAKSQSRTKAVNEFAQKQTDISKVVFSKTLQHAEHNTTIVNTDLESEILRLKQLPGKKISVDGVNLPSQLIALGLVDEFYFVVHPKIVGKGRRLMELNELKETQNLKLVESKIFKSGCMGLHYVKP